MRDPRLIGQAQLIVNYSLALEPGDQVAVLGSEASLSLMKEIYRGSLRAGAHCDIFVQPSWRDFIFFSEASDDQLAHLPDVIWKVYTEYDAVVTLYSTVNTRELSNVDPARQAARAKAVRPALDIFRARMEKREVRWLGSLHPTPGLAQTAEMSLASFEDFVYGSMYTDQPDPVKIWRKISEYQAKIVDWLDGRSTVEIKGPNVDLTLSIAGRRFLNADGNHNLPDGEVYTSPVENSANGWIRFSLPAAASGRLIPGVELEFSDGSVIAARAETQQDFLDSMLNLDEGARRLGELGIGTNRRIDRFINNPLFDEKIGGTIHLALGNGFARAGGTNESSLHWDMITELGEGGLISVDGEPFFKGGSFLVAGLEGGFPVA